MNKIIVEEEKFKKGMQEVIGSMFYNDNGEVIPPFEHLAEYFLIEMSEELMDSLMVKIESVGEKQNVDNFIDKELLRKDIAEGIATVLDEGDEDIYLSYVTDDEMEMTIGAMIEAESIEIHRMAEEIEGQVHYDIRT